MINYLSEYKLLLALCLLVACSCTHAPDQTNERITLDSGDTAGTVKLYGDNPRYLEYKGKPTILITSAEHYGAVINLDFDYRTYLETLAEGGFNYTRVFTGSYLEPVDNIFNIRKNTLAPLAGRFRAPWVETGGAYDLQRFSQEYLDRLKDFIRVAARYDIIVEVTLFSSIYSQDNWELSPLNGNNNSNGTGHLPYRRVNTLFNEGLLEYQDLFIRKIVRELNEFDNLFFEVQNEPWSDNGCLAGYVNLDNDSVFRSQWQKEVEVANNVSDDWQGWVVSVIREEESRLEKRHLIAQNICNFQVALDSIPQGVSILNFHYALPGAVRQNAHLKGVISLDETGFMPHEDSLYIVQAWRFILSGGGIYNNLDYSYTTGNERGNWTIDSSNPGWGGAVFRKKLSFLVDAVNQVPFHKMEFTDSVLRSSNTGMKQYGLQKPGEIYLVFVEDAREKTVVPILPSGDYKVIFIDVESGETTQLIAHLGDGESVTVPVRAAMYALLIQNAKPD